MADRFATFEIFVSQSVQKLMNDASWGRQTKELRKKCSEVLGAISLNSTASFNLSQSTACIKPTRGESNALSAHCSLPCADMQLFSQGAAAHHLLVPERTRACALQTS
jgi:hypothetical protein